MDRWGDYWRFTTASLGEMAKSVFGKSNIKVTSYGNLLAAVGLLQGIAVEDLPDKHLLDAVDQDYQVMIALVAKKPQ